MNSVYHTYVTIAALGVVPLVFSACSDKQESTVAESARSAYEKTSDSIGKATDTVADVSAEKWEQLKESTYDQRAEFRSGIDKMAASVDRNVEQWNEKAGELSGEAKETWNNGVAELREARENLKEELDRIGDASVETWNDARARVANAWERVEDAYQDLEEKVQS